MDNKAAETLAQTGEFEKLKEFITPLLPTKPLIELKKGTFIPHDGSPAREMTITIHNKDVDPHAHLSVLNFALKGAAKGNHPAIVEWCVDNGADWWWLACDGAAEGGHTEMGDFIIHKNYANEEQTAATMISVAIKHRQMEFAEYMFEKYANIDFAGLEWIPLALKVRRTDFARAMIEKHDNIPATLVMESAVVTKNVHLLVRYADRFSWRHAMPMATKLDNEYVIGLCHKYM